MDVILASASPRRRELLETIGVSFVVEPADIDELNEPVCPIESYAVRLAEKKAIKVAGKHPAALVIGCDTIVTIGCEVLGKPKDRTDAFNTLKKLSGREHSVITGVCLCRSNVIATFSVETRVSFNNLTDNMINGYLDEDEWKDKAGGYAIQGKGAGLVSKIDGDIYNVIGLPISRLKKEMECFMNIY